MLKSCRKSNTVRSPKPANNTRYRLLYYIHYGFITIIDYNPNPNSIPNINSNNNPIRNGQG